MQNRTPILAALVVGILAVVLTNMYVSQVRQEASPQQSQVMIASADLPAGTVLEADDVSPAIRYTQSLPKLNIPWSERNLYLGQELRMQVAAGDYVLISYFGTEASAVRLSEKVTARQNQRAFTIPVTNEMSLEGSIRAGDRIDLLITYQVPPALNEPPGAGGAGAQLSEYVSTTLLENVYVIATGRYDAAFAGNYKSITMMVTPDEAKLVTWANRLGELSVLLRNPKDVGTTERTFIEGDLRSLEKLGKVPLDVQDVVGREKPSE